MAAPSVLISFGVILVALSVALAIQIPSDYARVRENPQIKPRTFVPCNYTETPGASCLDCNTQLICTPIGGVQLTCWFPGPHCVDGLCSWNPSAECAPKTTESISTSTEFVPSTTTGTINTNTNNKK